MIEPGMHRIEGGTKIRKIQHPARLGIYFAGNMYFDSKRVPVQACAFVVRGYVGQAVRRLDVKNSKNIHLVVYKSSFFIAVFM